VAGEREGDRERGRSTEREKNLPDRAVAWPRCGVPDIVNGSTAVAGKRQGDRERDREERRERDREIETQERERERRG
jgi:hypothetical protein